MCWFVSNINMNIIYSLYKIHGCVRNIFYLTIPQNIKVVIKMANLASVITIQNPEVVIKMVKIQ